MPRWDADLEVTTDEARRLIESQFPALAPATLAHLGTGWDNIAFTVNRRYVFRFPRRQLGADLIEVELRVLPRIHDRLPLPVPHATHIGQPDGAYPWSFGGYPFIQGRTADTDPPSDEDRRSIARPLGEFLRSLHDISAEEARHLGATEDTIGRLDLGKRIGLAHAHIRRIKELGFITDTSGYDAVIADVGTLDSPAPTCLVHGDLYPRHLLLDGDNSLTGIIDWGDVHVGSPGADLMIAHLFLPPDAHDGFRDAYGDIDDATWRISRFRAVCYAAIIADYAHDIGDRALCGEYLRALDRAVHG